MGIVYAIRNIVNKKLYVGSTIKPKKRGVQHFSDLKRNRHPNVYLQRAYNKHGAVNFEWLVLETVDDYKLADTERRYIQVLKTNVSEYGYNLTDEPYAPMRGKHHTEVSKLKIGKKGSTHPNAKLTEELACQIFHLHASGHNQKEIGTKLQVDNTTVQLVLKGKTWKHIGIEPITARTNNKSGCVGVYFHKCGKWIAEIIKNKKYHRLGSFDTKEEAILARKDAERLYNGV